MGTRISDFSLSHSLCHLLNTVLFLGGVEDNAMPFSLLLIPQDLCIPLQHLFILFWLFFISSLSVFFWSEHLPFSHFHLLIHPPTTHFPSCHTFTPDYIGCKWCHESHHQLLCFYWFIDCCRRSRHTLKHNEIAKAVYWSYVYMSH